MKLNLGCGTDIRPGFINIDASSTLPGIDQHIDLSLPGALLEYFKPNTVDFVLANDIVEHLFHWQATSLLRDIHSLLNVGGRVQIRVPDCTTIISSDATIERMLVLLFGGQDIPQGDPEMDKSRLRNPEYFCHKYGWTRHRMREELKKVGFRIENMEERNCGTNFEMTAKK